MAPQQPFVLCRGFCTGTPAELRRLTALHWWWIVVYRRSHRCDWRRLCAALLRLLLLDLCCHGTLDFEPPRPLIVGGSPRTAIVWIFLRCLNNEEPLVPLPRDIAMAERLGTSEPSKTQTTPNRKPAAAPPNGRATADNPLKDSPDPGRSPGAILQMFSQHLSQDAAASRSQHPSSSQLYMMN